MLVYLNQIQIITKYVFIPVKVFIDNRAFQQINLGRPKSKMIQDKIVGFDGHKEGKKT